MKYESLDGEPYVLIYRFYSEYIEYDIFKYYKLTIDQYVDRTIADQQRMITFVKHLRAVENRIKNNSEPNAELGDDLLEQFKDAYEN